MYSEAITWIAIIAAGIAGCIMTAVFAKLLKGVPIEAVAGNWAKHVWSIIFALPVPYFVSLGDVGIFIAAIWLILVPTIASKIHFGPKDVPVMVLNAFHSGYAVAVLATYGLVRLFS